jgi:hypothetical protein
MKEKGNEFCFEIETKVNEEMITKDETLMRITQINFNESITGELFDMKIKETIARFILIYQI